MCFPQFVGGEEPPSPSSPLPTHLFKQLDCGLASLDSPAIVCRFSDIARQYQGCLGGGFNQTKKWEKDTVSMERNGVEEGTLHVDIGLPALLQLCPCTNASVRILLLIWTQKANSPLENHLWTLQTVAQSSTRLRKFSAQMYKRGKNATVELLRCVGSQFANEIVLVSLSFCPTHNDLQNADYCGYSFGLVSRPRVCGQILQLGEMQSLRKFISQKKGGGKANHLRSCQIGQGRLHISERAAL